MIKKYQDKEWLRKKYISEGLSGDKIGEICGVWRTTIYDWLNIFDIKRDKKYMQRDWLMDKYVNKKLTTAQIGEMCGVGTSTINRNLKKFDIPIRSLSEAFLGCTRRRTKEHNRKIGEANKGKIYLEETKRKISESLIGKYLGEKNPSWKGGITPLVMQIRNSFKYRQWRSDVFTRDKFNCQMCGDNRGGNLEAHHKKLLTSLIRKYEITTSEEAFCCEELWNINNGVTLCEDCHKEIHKKRGKKCLKNL